MKDTVIGDEGVLSIKCRNVDLQYLDIKWLGRGSFQEIMLSTDDRNTVAQFNANKGNVKNTITLLKRLEQKNNATFFFIHQQQGSTFLLRHVHLEGYYGSLKTFMDNEVQNADNKFHDRWTILPEFCRQLAEAVAWLHRQKVENYEGLGRKLEPHNIALIKQCGASAGDLLKIILPQQLNLLNNIDGLLENDHDNLSIWMKLSSGDPYKNDVISTAMLIFYILSGGSHCYKKNDSNQGDKKIMENIRLNEVYLSDLEAACFYLSNSNNNHQLCGNGTCENETCKYRFWINSLGQHFVKRILKEEEFNLLVFEHSTSTNLFRHPFFWNNWKLVNFIEQTSNYLQGSNKNSKFPKRAQMCADEQNQLNFQIEEKEIDEIKKRYPENMAYLLEYNQNPKSPPKNIADHITLLTQIRNKCGHWNEPGSPKCSDAIKELETIEFITGNQVNTVKHSVFPDKFIIFWSVMFPKSLSLLWDELRKHEKMVASFPDFF